MNRREPEIIATHADYAALWLHMLDDHGVNEHSTHGDPVLIHGAGEAFGINKCGRTFRYAEDAPDFRAEHGVNTLRQDGAP